VGIDFGRYDARVSEESLYHSQIGAILQHVSCRAVPRKNCVEQYGKHFVLLISLPQDWVSCPTP
jgi:hypothetical protein